MRSLLALGLAAVVAMLLQTTVIPRVDPLPVLPDLMLVLAVYLGVQHPGVGGAVGAFLLGYFVDAFSGTVLGVNAFALSVVYAGAHLVSRRLWMEGGIPLMVVVFLGAAASEVASVAVTALVAAREPVWQHVLRFGLLEAGAAAVSAPAIFAAVAWTKRLVGAV